MIENTTTAMQDQANRALFIADAMNTGSPSRFIENQEKRGQQQLVHSDRLPTDTKDTDDQFSALGFHFGEPDPHDPMFRPASLPEGWRKISSDHDMWSYVIDPLGRRRVAIFYKAAFYDRSAFMRVCSVYEYVSERSYDGQPILTDNEWATPQAVTEVARRKLAEVDGQIATWSTPKPHWQPHHHEYAAKRLRELAVEREKYTALAAAFDQQNAQ